MDKRNLNSKILKGIDENCEDENLKKFLKELLLLEASHSGIWWWKQAYKDTVKKYTK